MQRNMKLRLSAMRMAQRSGVNPYDSAPKQGKCFDTLVRMNIGRIKSEFEANRLLRRK